MHFHCITHWKFLQTTSVILPAKAKRISNQIFTSDLEICFLASRNGSSGHLLKLDFKVSRPLLVKLEIEAVVFFRLYKIYHGLNRVHSKIWTVWGYVITNKFRHCEKLYVKNIPMSVHIVLFLWTGIIPMSIHNVLVLLTKIILMSCYVHFEFPRKLFWKIIPRFNLHIGIISDCRGHVTTKCSAWQKSSRN